MSFTDTGTVAELSLGEQIIIEGDGGSWVTGKVVELSLLGDDEVDVRVMLKTPTGETISLDRPPRTLIVQEWGS